jgi:predicted outer membrane repeat protein
LTVTGTLFHDNAAVHGGAIRALATGTVLLKSTKFIENTASHGAITVGGGALYLSGSVATTIQSGSFLRNFGEYDGGAITVKGAASIHIMGSKLLGNSTRFSDGGAIFYNSTAASEIKASVISGNIAGDEGGGICRTGTGILKLIATLVSGNAARVGPNIFP